jgi:hypothetical protein
MTFVGALTGAAAFSVVGLVGLGFPAAGFTPVAGVGFAFSALIQIIGIYVFPPGWTLSSSSGLRFWWRRFLGFAPITSFAAVSVCSTLS